MWNLRGIQFTYKTIFFTEILWVCKCVLKISFRKNCEQWSGLLFLACVNFYFWGVKLYIWRVGCDKCLKTILAKISFYGHLWHINFRNASMKSLFYTLTHVAIASTSTITECLTSDPPHTIHLNEYIFCLISSSIT